jgi:hypothetical protein
MLCEYGCGQEAFHQLKNKKFCCSKNSQQCPNQRKISSKLHKGKIHNKPKFFNNIDHNLCEYGCGQEAKFQFKNGKLCCSDIVGKCEKKKLYGKNSVWFGRSHTDESKNLMKKS